MNEEAGVLGFLGTDGVLYCSRACAARQGTSDGEEVDQDEYESLLESESVRPGSVCPGCGAEFVVSWPGRGPE